MRIITQTSFGGPEVLTLAEAPPPTPLPTEVLVRVRAAGVNPVDWKTRAGKGVAAVLGDPPFTLGWDVAGVVEAVGPGVTTLAPGDAVFGMPWFPRAAGGYAEYVTAPSRQFCRKPPELSFEQAGGLSLAGLTAWQSLVDVAHVWSTAFVVYLDPAEWRRRPLLYGGVPIALFAGGVADAVGVANGTEAITIALRTTATAAP